MNFFLGVGRYFPKGNRSLAVGLLASLLFTVGCSSFQIRQASPLKKEHTAFSPWKAPPIAMAWGKSSKSAESVSASCRLKTPTSGNVSVHEWLCSEEFLEAHLARSAAEGGYEWITFSSCERSWVRSPDAQDQMIRCYAKVGEGPQAIEQQWLESRVLPAWIWSGVQLSFHDLNWAPSKHWQEASKTVEEHKTTISVRHSIEPHSEGHTELHPQLDDAGTEIREFPDLSPNRVDYGILSLDLGKDPSEEGKLYAYWVLRAAAAHLGADSLYQVRCSGNNQRCDASVANLANAKHQHHKTTAIAR